MLPWLLPPGADALPGQFSETTVPAGIGYQQYGDEYETTAEVQVLTGGAAAGDFDGDGWVDLFVTRVDNTDILYRNRGGNRVIGSNWFEDVSEAAGITVNDSTNGAAWGDIDNDGDLDLLVTAIEATRFYLYVNQGDGTFLENAVQRGIALIGETDHNGFSVTFGDYDRDGWLDIHICEWGIPRSSPGLENHSVLLRNLGDLAPGYFVNVTRTAGVEMGKGLQEKLYAFSSSFADMDADGWLDLVVTSDFRTSQLFWNNGDGTFTEGTVAAGVNKGSSEMGSAIGDYNQDGLLDWFVTCIEDNRLYRNLGDRKFSEEAEMQGLQNAGWGWGTQFLDMENDGDLDLIMTNGYHTYTTTKDIYYSSTERDLMHLWRNDEGSWFDVGKDLGIQSDGEGKGLLLFDYDRDGDHDVFVTNTGEPAILYRNDIDSGNAWLRLELQGIKSNSRGIGSRVKVITEEGATPRYFELSGANNYLSQSEAVVHIGLGSLQNPVYVIEIQWPSGRKQIMSDVAINQHLTVDEPYYYGDWAADQFKKEDLDNPEVVGLEVDLEGDGLHNLWEYAFGLNPMKADFTPPYSLLPVPGDENHYQFSYFRAKESADLVYVFEYSLDMQNWKDLEIIQESLIPGEENDMIELVFKKVGPCFVRLLVELVP